jgi:oligopeptide transport system permease protein
MKYGLLFFSILSLLIGIILSSISTITIFYNDIGYGNGSVAYPPQNWRYQYWSILSKGFPNSTVFLPNKEINFSGVHAINLNKTSFYVFSVNGYVQPYAILSIPGLFLIFIGTAFGFRSSILLMQERILGELSSGYAISGSLSRYLLKRFSSFLISMSIVSIVIYLLEIIQGISPMKDVMDLLEFNEGLSKLGVSVDSLLLTSLSYTSLLSGIAFSFTVYLSTFLVMKSIGGGEFLLTLIQKWKYIGNALASWVIGIALLYSFHYYFRVFPIGSPRGHLIFYIILPLLSLFFPYIGIFANRIIYSLGNTSDINRAKGLSKDIIVYRHIVGNLMVVTLSTISSAFVEMLIAEFLIEAIYSWPGLGYLLRFSVDTGDIRVVEGILLIYSTIVLISNFIADVIYGIVDPRVRR